MFTRSWYGWRVTSNVPRRLPGLYRFTNLVNGKVYVGISKNVHTRCKGHGEKKTSSPKFANAIGKYGRQSFLCEPLFYWTSEEPLDRAFLCEIEAEFIALHNSVSNGYNVQDRSNIGPFGAEWKARHDAMRWKMAEGSSRSARNMNLTPERRSEIGRMCGLIGGRKGALAQRAKMTPEEIWQMCSNGGRTNAEALATNPTHRDTVGAKLSKSVKAHWDEIRTDPVAFQARRDRHKIADHSSPQARENYRKASFIREAKHRAGRHDFEALLSGFAG